jgi:hypothetical protein
MIGSLLQLELRDGMWVLDVPKLDVPDPRMVEDLGLGRRDRAATPDRAPAVAALRRGIESWVAALRRQPVRI